MNLDIEKEGLYTIVRPLESRLDAHVSVSFRTQMSQLMAGGASWIIVDLSQVEFIDSSGLGAIVSVLKAMGKEGRLLLCGVHEAVMSMFRLTRMDRVFSIHATVEETLRAVA